MHAIKDVPPNNKISNMRNVDRLYKLVNTVTSRTNDYPKARRILARVLAGHKESLPVKSESFREVLSTEPAVDRLRKAADLMLLVAACKVTPYIP